MKTRTSLVVWSASLVVGLIVYVFTTAPAWVLMRNSNSILATVAEGLYSPMYFLRQHSELADRFFQQQWDFWFPILG
jgi:membrane glycosyltransferase